MILLLSGACSREPIAVPCPDLVAGDLVVTEIRGAQVPEPGYGEWIELYNASKEPVDLLGLRVQLTRLVDGTAAATILLHEGPIQVPPGTYFVIGGFPSGEEPAHVALGYGDDFTDELPNGAAVDLFSCGVLVDRMIYRELPAEGTWSFTGAVDPPEGGMNDDEDAWCVDQTADEDTETMGIRGTPGEANIPCE